jgi:hypothetical protein
MDTKAGRDGICSSCLAHVVEEERESLKKSEKVERVSPRRVFPKHTLQYTGL